MYGMQLIEQRSIDSKNNRAMFWRHPRMMTSVVSIRGWERFSFYGMQAILGFYLYYSIADGGLGIAKKDATALIGAYGALVYLCTFIGGWVGDHLLGAEKTLLSGAALLVIGHISLSTFPGFYGLAIGLPLIAVGSGLLKTAAITVLGAVYDENPKQRETGFQFFYLGIQLAAFFGPLLTGWLTQQYSFHIGFIAAAFLMIIGISLYVFARPAAMASLCTQTRQRITQPQLTATTTQAIFIVGGSTLALFCATFCVATGLIKPVVLATFLLALTLGAALLLYTSMFRSSEVTPAEKIQLLRYIPIFLASVAFWAIMNQTYGVLAVYSDVRLNRSVGNFLIPAAWLQSLNPFYVFVLSLPLAYLWLRLGDRSPRPATKLSIGVGIAGLGFAILIPYAGGEPNSTPFIVLAISILVTAIGELLIGPIGMAATAQYAPRKYATQFSAMFFLTMAIGTALSGHISQYYNPDNAQAEARYFIACSATAMVIGIISYMLTRIITTKTQ